LQLEQLVEPVQGAKLPSAQLVHDVASVAPEYLPAAQLPQAVEPASYMPGPQLAHSAPHVDDT